jgi:hypothetical protein
MNNKKEIMNCNNGVEHFTSIIENTDFLKYESPIKRIVIEPLDNILKNPDDHKIGCELINGFKAFMYNHFYK